MDSNSESKFKPITLDNSAQPRFKWLTQCTMIMVDKHDRVFTSVNFTPIGSYRNRVKCIWINIFNSGRFTAISSYPVWLYPITVIPSYTYMEYYRFTNPYQQLRIVYLESRRKQEGRKKRDTSSVSPRPRF